MEAKYAVGDRVVMLDTLIEPADGDSPAQFLCAKGEVLIVRQVTDEKRPRNGVWPVYVSHEHITDRSFGVMLNQISQVEHPMDTSCVDSQESHLLPCPCCGSHPVRRPYMVVRDDWGNEDGNGVVFCTNCGLNVETCHGQAEAEKRWNTRNSSDVKRTIEFVGHGFPPKESTEPAMEE